MLLAGATATYSSTTWRYCFMIDSGVDVTVGPLLAVHSTMNPSRLGVEAGRDRRRCSTPAAHGGLVVGGRRSSIIS
jgi:hypothetical protein